MENKFKVGDLVEYIEEENKDRNMTVGLEYDVLNVKEDGVCVRNDRKEFYFYNPSSFKLIKQEQEPNYMMVWDGSEKNARKENVINDLRNDSRCTDDYPVMILNKAGKVCGFKYCKSIKQWEADNKPLFINSLDEKFFDGDIYYRVKLDSNTLSSRSIIYDVTDTGKWENWSEIMKKESAEKYIKDHKEIVVEMTMEEICKALGKTVKIIK